MKLALFRLHNPFFSLYILMFKNLKFGWHFKFEINVMKTTKWRYGITSRIPGVEGHHWFVADLDTQCQPCIREFEKWLYDKLGQNHVVKYRTQNGYHYIVFYGLTFRKLLALLADAPHIDEKWLKIGVKRGYWFLETHEQLPDNLPLEYMRARY